NSELAIAHRNSEQDFYQSTPEDSHNKSIMFLKNMPTYFKYADVLHIFWTEDFKKGSSQVGTFTKEAGLITENEEGMATFKAWFDNERALKHPACPSLEELSVARVTPAEGKRAAMA